MNQKHLFVSKSKKVLNKINNLDMSKGHRTILFETVKFIKNKVNLRNCH